MEPSKVLKNKEVDARVQQSFDEAERTHYFGLCKPDHSDCPYLHCGIRNGQLPIQRGERRGEYNTPQV